MVAAAVGLPEHAHAAASLDAGTATSPALVMGHDLLLAGVTGLGVIGLMGTLYMEHRGGIEPPAFEFIRLDALDLAELPMQKMICI